MVHAPVASQVDGSRRMLVAALQAPPPHTVPAGYLWQPPAPSQVPSVAQLAGGWAMHMPRVSAPPAAIRLQRPGCVPAAHVRQAPAQASSQQTPSLQMPLAHWLAALHAWPRPLGPQLPPMQAGASPVQSSAVWQLPVQAPLLHWNGAQVTVLPALQVPRPSQRLAATSAMSLEQRAGWQMVPGGYLLQAPRPSQRPLAPQPAAPVSAQRPIGSFVPAGTGWQLPSDPGRRQLKQASSQRRVAAGAAHAVAALAVDVLGAGGAVQPGAADPDTHITPDTQPAPS